MIVYILTDGVSWKNTLGAFTHIEKAKDTAGGGVKWSHVEDCKWDPYCVARGYGPNFGYYIIRKHEVDTSSPEDIDE